MIGMKAKGWLLLVAAAVAVAALALLPSPGRAPAQATATVTIGSAAVNEGDNATVTLEVLDAAFLGAWILDVVYDPAVVSPAISGTADGTGASSTLVDNEATFLGTVTSSMKVILRPGDGTQEIGTITSVSSDTTLNVFPSWTTPPQAGVDAYAVMLCKQFSGSVCNTIYASDTIRVTGASATGLLGDHPLAEITFQAIGSGGQSSTLDVVIQQFTDTVGGDLAVTDSDGSITITTPVVTVPGEIQEALIDADISTAAVTTTTGTASDGGPLITGALATA
ncbi:hypothetical protein LCGC14_3151940, partial [marine sediment metagenome]